MCDAGANAFIEHYFRDCIYTTRDAIGFSFGMASICCWLVAQLPQFVLNIRTKSVEALSSWFLAQWLLGDTCNLVGCLLTDSQLPTQTYTAMYFILADMVMMVQYIYYTALQRQQERLLARRLTRQQRHLHYMHHHGSDSDSLLPVTSVGGRSSDEEAGPVSVLSSGHLQTTNARPVASSKQRGVISKTLASLAVLVLVHQSYTSVNWQSGSPAASAGRALLSLRSSHPNAFFGVSESMPQWAKTAGVWLGYVSSVFYLSSRLSQIYKNYARKCTGGLSVAMFLMAISANVSYGLGILIRTYSWEDFQVSFPWLLGSLGVVLLDVVISLQGTFYPHSDRDPSKLRAPLLMPAAERREAFPSLSADMRRDQ